MIAGGYDTRLQENVDVHNELLQAGKEMGIEDKVILLRSISND